MYAIWKVLNVTCHNVTCHKFALPGCECRKLFVTLQAKYLLWQNTQLQPSDIR